MKIKLLVGLLLGLGIASISEAFTVDNETTIPVRISYEFWTVVCDKSSKDPVYRDIIVSGMYDPSGSNRHYRYAPCDLKWIHYYANYDGTWKYENTARFNMGSMTSAQTVTFSTIIDRLGEPRVKMTVRGAQAGQVRETVGHDFRK